MVYSLTNDQSNEKDGDEGEFHGCRLGEISLNRKRQ